MTVGSAESAEAGRDLWPLGGCFLAWVKGCMVQKGTSAWNESRRRRRRLPTEPQFTSGLMCYRAFLQGTLLCMDHHISNLKIFDTYCREAEWQMSGECAEYDKLLTSFSERLWQILPECGVNGDHFHVGYVWELKRSNCAPSSSWDKRAVGCTCLSIISTGRENFFWETFSETNNPTLSQELWKLGVRDTHRSYKWP